tara:strand:- start:1211 stop:2305 length:1095 start_codon:yes stop_codon:yes gene_type:complete
MNDVSKFLISVVIPVYNGKDYLLNCLNLLTEQDFQKEFEIILVNDASSDSFHQILKNVEIKNLKIFNFEKNKGQSAARNFGIKEASGKYIFFMDVDDQISKNSFNILFETAEKENFDYVFSDFQRIENSKNQRTDKYNYAEDLVFFKNDIIFAMERELYDPTLGHLGLFGCNGRLIRRKLLVDNNILFDENIRWLEDKIFAWNVLKHVQKAKYVREQLYSYFVNPSVKSAIVQSLSSVNSVELLEIILNHIKKSLKFVGLKDDQIKKLYNQGLIFFSIQILVSLSRSISLKKINNDYGLKVRKKIIKEIIYFPKVRNAIKFYKPSKEESQLIPIALKIGIPYFLELACNFRARQVIKKRRLGKN